MQRGSIFFALAAFLLIAGFVLGAGARAAAAGETGRAWDDSHMLSRHQPAGQGVIRPKLVLGKDRFERAANDPAQTPGQRPPETLSSHTQHSWAADGNQSIRFGSQPARGGRSVGDGLSGLSRGSQLRSAASGGSGGRSSRGGR
jgi:hypothetical protein